MKVDARNSIYQEAPTAEDEFDVEEIRRLRLLLRRLRYLDEQVRRSTEAGDTSGGAIFAEMEREALAWLLTDEVPFLETRKEGKK